MTKREQEIQREILAFLDKKGVLALRINSGMIKTEAGGMVRGAPAGTSDILACIRGRFAALEVKTAKGTPTALQEAFLDRVRTGGGIAAVVRSVEDAATVLADAARRDKPRPITFFGLSACPFCGVGGVMAERGPNAVGHITYTVECWGEDCEVNPSTEPFLDMLWAACAWNRRPAQGYTVTPASTASVEQALFRFNQEVG